MRKSNRKRRSSGFRARSKTASGRRIIKAKRRRHGKFVVG
ncbi:MAG: 50S ribosomal protein L34 [Planctomycetota bacterium]|nr:MAG: 50S ribosomal protein L34 [Planctomycetota bacterium]